MILNKNLKKDREIRYSYIAAFITPIILWLIVFIGNGIYPFGDNSIMTGDITYQFIDYLSYFKSIITGNNDFVYTFSKTIGGDMAGFSTYYMFSPFNFIMLLFPDNLLPLALSIMIIVKCAAMSLSMQYMLTKLYSYKRESVIFAITYSMMGYVVVYFQLYAYFDDLMLLPLVILGIHKIIENNKKNILYIITLFLCICLNFYIGWMICIFSVLYFIYQLYINNKGKNEIISFVYSSFIAGTMSAFILLPSLLSLRGEKNAIHLDFYLTMNPLDMFSRLYTNSFKGDISDCLPNIYCGLFVAVLAILYFFNKKIRIKERIASLILMMFLIVNLSINTLNIVWHGFNRPIGFPFRYSFLLIFMMIILAYRNHVYQDRDNVIKKLLISGVVFLIYTVYLIINGTEILSKKDILINCAIMLSFLLVCYLCYTRKIAVTIAVNLLIFIQLFDLTENLYDAFKYFPLEKMSDYVQYIDEVGAVIDDVKKEDDSFYRMEKYFRRSHNDSMQFKYNGLSHYSSCEKKEIISFMGKIGFRDNGNWSFYDNGNTAFVDSIFGVKYLFSHYDTNGKPYIKEKRYKNYSEYYFRYDNPYALPLMFTAKDSVKDFNIDEAGDNPFEIQNKLADSVNGKTNNILKKATNIEKEIENLELSKDGDSDIYKIKNENKESYIKYIITVEDENHKKILNGYFTAKDTQDANIRCKVMEDEYFTKYHWGVLDFGKKSAGNSFKIYIEPKQEEISLNGSYFYFEDYDALKKWYDEISKDKCELNKLSSSHLKGTVNCEENKCLVFSFPYETGWEVKIDGKKCETFNAAGIFLGTNIEAGHHEVEVIYHAEGQMAGIIISIVSIIIVLLLKRLEKQMTM